MSKKPPARALRDALKATLEELLILEDEDLQEELKKLQNDPIAKAFEEMMAYQDEPMTIHEARLIRYVSQKATLRTVAAIYYPPGHDLKGNQLAGNDLVRQAMEMLGKDDIDFNESGRYDPWWDTE